MANLSEALTLDRQAIRFLSYVSECRESGVHSSNWSLWQSYSSNLEQSKSAKLQEHLERTNVLNF